MMARPARCSAAGDVLEIKDDVSRSSDWSSASRSASWVVAKEGMSIASFGAMFKYYTRWDFNCSLLLEYKLFVGLDGFAGRGSHVRVQNS